MGLSKQCMSSVACMEDVIMTKKFIVAAVAVFIAWSVMDFVIHGVILADTYGATAELWRPEAEMKYGLIYFVTACNAVIFAGLYSFFVGTKNVQVGLLFGLLFGIAVGLGMGYGTYAVMPIPYKLALSWFLGTVAEGAAAGLLVGVIAKEPAAEA